MTLPDLSERIEREGWLAAAKDRGSTATLEEIDARLAYMRRHGASQRAIARLRRHRDAVAPDERQSDGCWECGTSNKRGDACAEHQEARDAVYREREQAASREIQRPTEDNDG